MSDAGKRKVSLTLDADLLDALDVPPRALSGKVNDLLRAGWEEEQYQQHLSDFADRLYTELGLDTPENEAELARLAELGQPMNDFRAAS